MPSDDELRRVAEDVRALARSLSRDIRSAVERAREDLYGPGGDSSAGRRSAREDLAAAGRAARQELHQARMAVRRSSGRRHNRYDPYGTDAYERHHWWPWEPGDPGGPGLGSPPRWDNWGRNRDRRGLAPAGWGWRGRSGWLSHYGAAVRDRVPAAAPVAGPPLRHRHDGSTLLGLLAVVFGLAWLAAGTHLASVSTEAVVAVALMVLGAATVVTARTDWALSRRSWPVVGGAALAVTLLALSASPGMPGGFRHLEFGSRTVAPSTWADVPATVHGGFGRTLVDLRGLPGPLSAPRALAVDGAAGRLEINLPTDVKVILDARVVAGQIDVNGVATSGLHRVDNETLDPSAPGPALTLHVQSGFGSVAISQLPKPLGGGSGVAPPAPSAPKPPGGIG